MKNSLQCIVLAGGLGTRMRPLTETLPKAMLPVAGKPFAEHQLEFLIANGVTEVVYLIGYRGNLICRHFGTGEHWGIRIRYVDEGTQLRGTGGALRLALSEGALAPEFLLIYGDSYTPVSIAAVWDAFQASPLPALMTVLRNEERWDRSNVLFENNRIVVYDKTKTHPRTKDMRHIDYGLSALRREVVEELIPATVPADLAPVFNRLSLEGKLAGFEATNRFYEIGSPGGLPDFESYLLAGNEARR